MSPSQRLFATILRVLCIAAACIAAPALAAWQALPSPGLATLSVAGRTGELAIAPSARLLAVALDDVPGVALVATDTGTVTGTIALANKAIALALDATGSRLYVVQEDGASISVYDVATRTAVASWNIGGKPVALATRPGTDELVVLDFSGRRIVAVDPSNGTIVRQKALGTQPERLFLPSSAARVLVGTHDGALLTLDATTWATVSSAALGDSVRSVTYWESQGVAIVVQKRQDAVALVNVETGAILARIGIDTDPDHAVADAGTSKAYVTTKDDLAVSRIDLGTRRAEGRFVLPTEASSMMFDAATGMLYVGQPRDKAIVRLDPAQNFLIGALTLAKRLRDIAVNNASHEAAAIADKANELSRLRLADQSFETLALPDRPSRIAVDAARNLAIVAFKSDVRFADLAASPAAMLPGSVDAGGEINALAVDGSRGLTLVTTNSQAPLTLIDNATRARLATIATSEKLGVIAIDGQRGVAYIAAESRKVLAFDLAIREFTRSIALPFKPAALAVDPALGLAVVLDDAADRVYVLDLASQAIVQSFAVPRHPIAVDIQPDTHVAVVASKESDQLSLVDLVANAVTAGYATVDTPFALATSVRYNEALVLSGEKDEVTIVPLPNARPVLDSIAPLRAPLGAAALVLTANGSHFVDRSRVIFGTTELATRWISPAKVEADLPAALLAAAGSFDVLVRTPSPGGGDSASLPFVVVPPGPSLASLSPANVAADSQPHTITLFGQGFSADAVVLADSQVLTPANVTPSQIAVVVPATAFTAPGAVSLKVRNADGQESGALSLGVNARPDISSVAPASIVVDGVAHALAITGSGFQAGAIVVANGTMDLTPSAVTATQVTVSAPASLFNAPGVLSIAVRNPDGGLSPNASVTLTTPAAPFLYSVLPSSIMAGSPATEVTLSGASFASGAAVRAGSGTPVTLATQFVNSQQVRATIPASLLATPGDVPLVVVNPGAIIEGARTSNAAILQVTPAVPLQIAGIVPQTGQAGDTVIVFGQGFASTAAGNVVTFAGPAGRLTAAVAVASETQVSVVAPNGVVTGPVQVTVNGSTATGPTFTVAAPNELEYALIAGPSRITLVPGGRATFEVALGANANAFTGLVKLSVSGLPAGVTATFTPANVAAGQVAMLDLVAAPTATPGTFSLTVSGVNRSTSTPTSQAATATLEVGASGQTGVTGRFIDARGKGVSGVRIRAGDKQVVSDTAGNFTLLGLAAGDTTLRLDATPANPLYPIWPYNVAVVQGRIIAIPDWRLADPPADANFQPITVSNQDQVLSDPRFPGMNITIPANAQIIGWDGVPKTRVAIEKLDADRIPVTPPPIPTRSVYQLFFGTPMGGIPTKPIPVTLPNDLGLEPGDQTEIWFYDGSPMGGDGKWKVAGTGTVSTDGTQVVMGAGQGIPRFCGVCGLMCLKGPDPDPNPNGPPPDNGPDSPAGPNGPDNNGPGPDGPPGPGPNGPTDGPTKDPDPPKDTKDPGDSPKDDKPKADPCSGAGNPVALMTGSCSGTVRDISIGGLMPVDLARRFNPYDAFNKIAGAAGSFGLGWVNNYDVVFLPFDGPQKRLVMPGNMRINFVLQPDGSYANVDAPTFAGARFRQVDASTWELRFRQGGVWRFEPFSAIPGRQRGGPPLFLTQVAGPEGNALSITRNTAGRMTAIGSGARVFNMTYGSNGFVSQITDPLNRAVRFTYTASDRIESITQSDGGTTRYTYVEDDEFPSYPACEAAPGGVRIKNIQYPGRTGQTENFYGAGRRVLRQTRSDGAEMRFAYKVVGACVTNVSNPSLRCTGADCPDVDSWENHAAGWRIIGGRVVSTKVVNPSGNTAEQRFNAAGFIVETVDYLGQVSKYERDPVTNLVMTKVDPLGRRTRFQYDADSNVIAYADKGGRLVTQTFDAKWKKPTSISASLDDGQAVVHSVTYHPQHGRIASYTDPLGNRVAVTYTARGELETITDENGKVTRREYNPDGDLIKVTDPLGHATTFAYDAAGRMTKITDGLGHDTSFVYNSARKLHTLTDAIGGVTTLGYDSRRNLTSITDARGNVIRAYAYDDRNRLIRSTDAAGRSIVYGYDAAGALRSFTDRRGNATIFDRDEKSRPTTIRYADGTSKRFAYDAAERLASLAGPASRHVFRYDSKDRTVQVDDTFNGITDTIRYQYDALGRVTRRTVNGSDATDYAFDRGGRLQSITYRGQSTQYTWDAGGRLVEKRYPNGVRQVVAYDDADRIATLTYSRTDGSVIEQIAYEYDASNRVTRKTSTVAAATPATRPMSASYDTADRMRTLTLKGTGPGGTDQTFSLSYDASGNLIEKRSSDGTEVSTFSWDAQDRLIGVARTGARPSTATFTYDAIGRRVERIVDGVSTRYIYDDQQAIAEVRTAATTNFVTARHVLDEIVARYTGAESQAYLIDALGSVLALAKDDQGVSTRYSYGPFGELVAEGDASTNSTQYTSRENDSTGLYFYRARYYDPELRRFISEDPAGLVGVSPNPYAYVDGDPMSGDDPTGEAPPRGGGGRGGGGSRWDRGRTDAENVREALRDAASRREAEAAWRRQEQERADREQRQKDEENWNRLSEAEKAEARERMRLNGDGLEHWTLERDLHDYKEWLKDPQGKNKGGVCRP